MAQDPLPLSERIFFFILRLIKLPGKAKNFAIEQIKHHYYVITTNGLGVSKKYSPIWEEKWKKPSNMRVLMVAPKDFAGSFYGWAKAVNKFDPNVSCKQVSLFKHRYGYDYDYIFHSFAKGFEKNESLKKIIDESDCLHLKDEFYFFNPNYRPLISRFIISLIEEFKKKNKPIVFTHFGSLARRQANNLDYQRAVLDFDARIALTPDLNFEWFNGYFVPHAIDLNQFHYSWSPSKIFAHSPSSRALKGSGHMLDALSKIDDMNHEWRRDIIENVSYKKCMERKSKAELFFDQAGVDYAGKTGTHVIGWYGNSAVEAMAFGIPTIAHLSEIALQRSKNAGKDIEKKCPILNTGIDALSMKETVLNYLHLSLEDKQKLSQTTRQWVEDFHSETIVGNELGKIYKNCIQKN